MSRIRADQLVNRAGSGGPKFPHGVADGFSVSGIVTATSFAGNLTGNVTGNADTATNAQGLTGTPNITVGTVGCGTITSSGDVTGVNATFSGNLTVNGTTTTIDTAVTSVDSLAVDGQITAGSIGIGTDNPNSVLPLTIAGSYPGIQFKDNQGTTDFNLNADNDAFKIQTGTAGAGPVERFRITSGGTLFSYSPDDTTPNFKFRSNDTNWHGALNQSVEGGTITSFLSCGGDWDANGTTYSCTKNVATYPSSAIAVHNQYNSSFESKFVFLNKAGGSTTTDGGVTELASISSAGVISDSIGPLRRLDIVSTSGDLTLSSASHAGRLIRMTSTNRTFTIPSGSFSSGDMITIFHVGTGNMTIAQGSSVTLYNAADGATGNRTLAAKGMVTIACTDGPSNEFVISGSQLS